MSAVFRQLAPGDKAFFAANQESVDLLSAITAVDKALSVPYLRIYEVSGSNPAHDDGSGNPIAPISLQLTQPPAFGRSVDSFAERPPVSLEKISIRTEMNYGMIQWRKIDLSFVVHRPDVIFEESNPEFDTWSTLMIPGKTHAVDYGWSGPSKNDLLNGNGISEAGVVKIEGRQTLVFTVVNYQFQIQPNGEFKITIHGIENGENTLRNVSLGDLKTWLLEDSSDKRDHIAGASKTKDALVATSDERGKQVIAKLQRDVKTMKTSVIKKTVVVSLEEILNRLIAPMLEASFRDSGYEVELYMGNFNTRVGRAKDEFGGLMSDKSIGDFKIPLKWIETNLAAVRQRGAQLTVTNFLENILSRMNDASSWKTGLTDGEKKSLKKKSKEVLVDELRARAKIQFPQILTKVRSIKRAGKNVALFYIVDLMREKTVFDESDVLSPDATRDQIREKLRSKGVPLISFRSGLSYIQDAQFEVQQDPLMKTIFIQNALRPSSQGDVVEKNDASRKDGMNHLSNMYSSAIDGNITMLGNFVFDTFALVWLEFGVKVWDGPFFIMEKEDEIMPGIFTSKLRYKSAGDDPLNTQGRLAIARQEEQDKFEKDAAARLQKKPAKRSKQP